MILSTMSSPEKSLQILQDARENMRKSNSIITSPIPVQEEIDIFPDDLIPPGVENDHFEDEDNSTFLPEHESPNLDHQDNPSVPRPPPEPLDVKIRLEPDNVPILVLLRCQKPGPLRAARLDCEKAKVATWDDLAFKLIILRVYTSPITLIGGDPRKNDTVDMKEAQGNKAYTLEVLTKEAQPVTIMDCHAGNPCELEIDLTAKSSSPIIEGISREGKSDLVNVIELSYDIFYVPGCNHVARETSLNDKSPSDVAPRIDQEEVFVVWFFWKEREGSILFGLPGSRQQKFLVLRFFDIKEQQGIVSVVRFISQGYQNKQKGLRISLRLVEVKHRKLDGNIIQKYGGSKHVVPNNLDLVSYGDTAMAQRRLEDKQPEEKTNTDCLSSLSKVFWAEDTTMSTYLVNRSPSSAIGFKTPIDMLGFFGWLASIKQGMLEPVKVKCIFLGYRKGVVGNKALEVLQGDEFEVEPQGGHTFEMEPHRNVGHVVGLQEDSNEVAFAVAVVEKIYAHESLTFNNTVACEVISKWKAGLKDDMDARSDVYVLSNGCKNAPVTTAMAITGSLHQGSLSGDYDVEKNGKWSCIYAVGSQEYQMVCTRLDIASADVGMLDKFDRGLQTDVQRHIMTLTGSWKKKIWLKGLMAESGYELSLVAGIATGALVKGGSRSEVPAQVEGAAYRY
ncbi:hypothetical protein Tco_0011640 [Tanacetum coccineum]